MKRNALLLASGFWLLACAASAAQQAAPPSPTPRPAIAAPEQPMAPFAQAQTPRPGQAPAAPRPPQGPPPATLPVPGVAPPRVEMATQVPPAPPRAETIPTQNVRVDLVITDSAAPAKKAVTILTAEGRNGRVRSQAPGSELNVDARADAVANDRVLLNLTLVYFPGSAPEQRGNSVLNESITVLVANGKPTVISQSADPTVDRKVTVEVTATIVK